MNRVATHPHVIFFIMEAVLDHHPFPPPPKKKNNNNNVKIAHDVHTEKGSDFALASIFYYLKRNRFRLK